MRYRMVEGRGVRLMESGKFSLLWLVDWNQRMTEGGYQSESEYRSMYPNAATEVHRRRSDNHRLCHWHDEDKGPLWLDTDLPVSLTYIDAARVWSPGRRPEKSVEREGIEGDLKIYSRYQRSKDAVVT